MTAYPSARVFSDQDEFEERVEKLNKVTLQVMAKSLGLTKEEQLQKVCVPRWFFVECGCVCSHPLGAEPKYPHSASQVVHIPNRL